MAGLIDDFDAIPDEIAGHLDAQLVLAGLVDDSDAIPGYRLRRRLSRLHEDTHPASSLALGRGHIRDMPWTMFPSRSSEGEAIVLSRMTAHRYPLG